MARIVILTPNPAIDVTYAVEHFVAHDTNRVETMTRRAGGKGVNVSRVLERLGHSSVNVMPLGGAAGEWMSTELAKDGMQLRSSPIAAETRTTVTVTDGLAHPTLLAEPGPRLDDVEVEKLASLLRAACVDADILVISGSLPPGLPASQVERWVRDARDAGVRTIVDTSGEGLLAGARAGADILKPNETELLAATATDSLEAGIARLQELGARTVIVSRGSSGLVAREQGDTVRVPAVPGVSGNPTGAGDAATAGVVSAMVDGLPIEAMLQRASALGAAAVLTPIAGAVDLDAYARFLGQLDLSPRPSTHPPASGGKE